MRSLEKQRGMTSAAWLALVLVVGFVTIVGIRVVPAYIDYYTVVSVAQSVQRDPGLSTATSDRVREVLRKRMNINNVDDLGDAITIKRPGGDIELTIDYEVRRDLFGNMALVMHFQRRVGP